MTAGAALVAGSLALGGRIVDSSEGGDETEVSVPVETGRAPPIGPVTEPVAAEPAATGRPDHLAAATLGEAEMPPAAITPFADAGAADFRSVALDAYRAAARQWPSMGCRGSWTILAAIGHTESSHGLAAGAVIVVADNGDVTPRILGPLLDGSRFSLVIDTDEGLLDDNDEYDRAVGPMQFMPATWGDHQIDGNGDGVADPHNLYDASLAAASYLCTARSGNLDHEPTLREALYAYNQSEEYVLQVLDLIDWYATGRMGTRAAGGGPAGELAAPTALFDLDPDLFVTVDDEPDTDPPTDEEDDEPTPSDDDSSSTPPSEPPGTTTTTTTTLPIPSTIWLTVLPLDVPETDSPTPQRASVDVWIDQAVGIDVVFDWATVAGTASEGTDYVGSSGQATIPSGARSVSLSADILGDELFEGDEQFAIEIRPVTSGVQFTDGDRIAVTILDDDDPDAPTLG